MKVSKRQFWTLPLAIIVAAAAVLATGAGQARANFCWETVNPAGNPAVGDNGHSTDPQDPFGGDAVPGGKSTTPGNKGNGPANSDGFYLVYGYLFSDNTPIEYPGYVQGQITGPNDNKYFWPYQSTVKYTETGNKDDKTISVKKMAGPNSVIDWHIKAPGDLYVGAPKDSTQPKTACLVPPPPF